ncbi:MAG TPA: adenylate/guanylate cyclase domain-containing protein [Spirochaetia bacterium]|nr:adenylate/guanylate cyclase domain-containing protein [Spirochaetia bacterium]
MPLVTKIVLIFVVLILVSNFCSNYINLMFNRSELIVETKELLVKDLKDVYNFASSQYEIFQFTNDAQKSMDSIQQAALRDLKNSKAVVLGVKADGTLGFQASQLPPLSRLTDQAAVTLMTGQRNEQGEGTLYLTLYGSSYFGVYKYNAKWDMVILRAEDLNQLYAPTRQIFFNVSIIIVALTLIAALVGVALISYILRFVGIITTAIMNMRKATQMEIIDLPRAPNDEITFLGVAFNALSSTVNTLVTIFRKFVSKDLALKAYREMQIRLEGSRQELTILFSDIRSFTTMTETLGTDIIKLLNLHYERAIGAIVQNDGIIGSLIGDAVLAVYGTFAESHQSKTLSAIKSAYLIQENAAELRKHMAARREQIIRERGGLSEEEERIYRAVLLEVGVGIDGGEVFYGNIGSQERMTNTVIGDNVNSASRMEGLTRIYNVPVIVSEYAKNDVESAVPDHGIRFLEIDKVQVKGKTEGKRVYWAILEKNLTEEVEADLEIFAKGLQLYYEGEWSQAYKQFASCALPLANVFKDRTRGATRPKDWNGVWAMTTK